MTTAPPLKKSASDSPSTASLPVIEEEQYKVAEPIPQLYTAPLPVKEFDYHPPSLPVTIEAAPPVTGKVATKAAQPTATPPVITEPAKPFNPFNVLREGSHQAPLPTSSRDPTVYECLSADEQQRWDDRKRCCGRLVDRYIQISPGEWRWRKLRYFCSLYQDGFCPSCAAWRRENLQRLARDAVEQLEVNGHSLSVLELSHDDANKLCRKLGKENYQRRPKKDGMTILFVPTDLVDDATAELYATSDLDWNAISDTPLGWNVSGNLGKRPDRPLDDDEIEIQVPILSISPDVSAEDESKAVAQAFNEICDKIKQDNTVITIENIESIIIDITELVKVYIETNGGKILKLAKHRFLNQRVKISSILADLGLKGPYVAEEIEKKLILDDGHR